MNIKRNQLNFHLIIVVVVMVLLHLKVAVVKHVMKFKKLIQKWVGLFINIQALNKFIFILYFILFYFILFYFYFITISVKEKVLVNQHKQVMKVVIFMVMFLSIKSQEIFTLLQERVHNIITCMFMIYSHFFLIASIFFFFLSFSEKIFYLFGLT